jgi:hypothetical protein
MTEKKKKAAPPMLAGMEDPIHTQARQSWASFLPIHNAVGPLVQPSGLSVGATEITEPERARVQAYVGADREADVDGDSAMDEEYLEQVTRIEFKGKWSTDPPFVNITDSLQSPVRLRRGQLSYQKMLRCRCPRSKVGVADCCQQKVIYLTWATSDKERFLRARD